MIEIYSRLINRIGRTGNVETVRRNHESSVGVCKKKGQGKGNASGKIREKGEKYWKEKQTRCQDARTTPPDP